MKINYKKFPSLRYLKNGLPKDILRNLSEAEMMMPLVDSFNEHRKQMENNIVHISIPFYESAKTSFSKLSEGGIIDQYINEGFCKVILLNNSVTFLWCGHNEAYIISQFIGDHLCFAAMRNSSDDKSIGFISKQFSEFISDNLKVDGKTFVDSLIGYSFCLCCFMDHAEIETKVLLPKAKVDTPDMTEKKTKNETDQTVTLVNCLWITNLVKQDDFKVRGHFRLQAYGEGWSKKRLIYIPEFVKHGYVAKARRVKNEEQ